MPLLYSQCFLPVVPAAVARSLASERGVWTEEPALASTDRLPHGMNEVPTENISILHSVMRVQSDACVQFLGANG